MMRIFFILIIVVTLAFLLLQGDKFNRSSEMPIFMRTDTIALQHRTELEVTLHSRYKPDSIQLLHLKNDYSNLWAHLNHLYATNDITAGKEYYTEAWFRQMAHHYNGLTQPAINRQDLHHELHIENWASDGLVLTAIDSNVVLQYHYHDGGIKTEKANLAIVMLYQGDHWRMDAMKVLGEPLN
jgi:hypothetical protein